MKIERNKIELNEVLKEQLYFLKESSHEYDKGIEVEAVRLAGHLRTLVHDSISNKEFDTNLIKKVKELKDILIIESKVDKTVFKQVSSLLQSVESKIKNAKKDQVTSRSLLTLLNYKDKIKYLDTSIKDRNSISFYHLENCSGVSIGTGLPYAGLLSKYLNGIGVVKKPTLKYQPLFFQPNFTIDRYQFIDFDEWWNGEIYDNMQGITLRRKDIILNVSNQEGFAHVGDTLDYNYVAYKQKNVLELNINGVVEDFDNIPVYATIRQIAFEFTESVKKVDFRQLFMHEMMNNRKL